MNNKFRNRSNNGITLIALVITIIVLLILAGVTISTLSGENGILTKSNNAKDENIIGEEKEQIALAYSSCKADNLMDKVTSEQMQTEMQNNGNKVSVSGSENLTITFTETTKHRYKIYQNGKIEKLIDLTPEDANKVVDIIGLGNDTALVLTADEKVRVINEISETTIKKLDVEEGTIITENGIKILRGCYFVDNENKLYEVNDWYTKCISDIEGSALKGKVIKDIIEQGTWCFAIDDQGKVYSCGHNSYGQLGDGTAVDSDVPICISDIEESVLNGKVIDKVFAGRGETFAIDNLGKVYSWGNNYVGQLGNGSETNSYIPMCISEIEGNQLNEKKIIDIKIEWHSSSVDYSRSSIIALDEQGKMYIWGDNSYGQLGNGTTKNANSPICISDIEDNALNGKKINHISCGNSIWVVDDKGSFYAWGDNSHGQLGNGTMVNSNVPICISNIEGNALKGKRINSVFVAYDKCFVVDSQGKLYSWGQNDYGRLGNGTWDDSNEPICISDIEGSELKEKEIISVFTNYDKTFVIDSQGKLYGWGSNENGQLGDGTEVDSNMPICISDVQGSILNDKKISKIYDFKYGGMRILDEQGKVYTWGNNRGHDQWGIGTTGVFNMPICINDIEELGLKNEKIIKIVNKEKAQLYCYLTEDGNVFYNACNEPT